jgi:HAE1 family hydrophobic/amphiphilic exporter-1/multidrug efflux pump
MTLSELSVKRPVLATMLNLGLILFGLIGLTRLPVRELPDVDPPIVNVTTIYPGANARVVETQVTEPMEEVLTSVEGIKKLTSESREQLSSITIEFDLGRPIEVAAQDVRDRVARVRGRLPDEIDEPIVAKQDADAQPSLWIALYSDRFSTLELTTLAESLFKDRLQTVPGVSSIFMGGAKRFAIRLWLDAEKMAARGVTVLDVERALDAQSVELPSGRIENTQRVLSIETLGQLKSPEEYNNLTLISSEDGTALVRLRDVGRAEAGVEDVYAVARFMSKPAMGIGIVKQSKANTIEVARGVKAELERIKPLLPAGINVSIPYDESQYIERSINEVWGTLWMSFALVILTIFVFLLNLRSTLIPTVTIPVSIAATFGVLYLFGFSVNIVTMLALVLAIGVVVDDAIVVLENIYRHIEAGMSPFEATILGMKEITFAVIATTISLIAVFLPLAFQTTVTGRMFIEFAVSISCAVAISSFVALTLAPMLASRVLRPVQRVEGQDGRRVFDPLERGLAAISRRYERALRWSLAHRPIVLAAALVSFGLMVFFYSRLQHDFMPEEDKGRLFCIVITPEGSTSEYTDRMVRKMEGMIAATPEVDGYFSAVALARGGPGRTNEGLAFIRLKDKRSRHVQDIVAGPQGLGAQFFMGVEGAIAIPIIPKAIGGGFGQAFQLILQYQDLDELNRVTQDVANRLRQAGFLMNVRPTFELNRPQLFIEIDRDRAAALNVSVLEIARTLQIMFGGLDLSKINLAGKEYDVIAQLAREARLTPTDLDKLYVRNGAGQLIQLSNVVTYRAGAGPSAIYHYNRFRSATIEGTPAPGVPLGAAVERAEQIAREALPADFHYDWSGEAEDLRATGRETGFVIAISLIVIYMVLAAQFESLVHPLTVMLTLPLGAVGAFGLLWLLSMVNGLGSMFYAWSHYAPNPPAIAKVLSTVVPRIPAMGINLFSQIGLILLLGLVTKNGILLVDFANQAMAKGKTAVEAMHQAGMIRLRPILMTATTTISGILPIAIGFGAGAESRRPMGVAAVGGMITSTIFTLIVVPVVYVMLAHLRDRFGAWSARRNGVHRKRVLAEAGRMREVTPS